MANFVEKIGEKLHMGGHKKEGEHEPGYGAAPHAAGHEQLGSHPDHAHGGVQQHFGEGGHVGYGGPGEVPHGSHPEHGHGGVQQHYGEGGHVGYGGAPAAAVHGGAAQPHEGPIQKIKHKVKKGDGDEGSSSSSSSESDGEGGRRKKHGLF